MNWQIRQILRNRKSGEHGSIPAGRGGAVSVCLVYPNYYSVAMSSLGFQTVYRLFNEQPDIVCERAFLPDREELALYQKSGDTLVSLENERPLSDFDLLAFSVSFEPDYINIPSILRLARIPELSAGRTDSHPLVIAGGAAFLINPEPAADFFDFIAIGEGEGIIPELSALLVSQTGADRDSLLEKAGDIPGLYLAKGTGSSRQTVYRQTAPPGTAPAHSVILADDTEFGNMFLVEVSRGCPRGCRFCAAGFVWQPFRQMPLAALEAICSEGMKHRKTVGLVGAAVSDYLHIEELCRHIIENGGIPSLSSLRVDRLTPALLEMMASSGHKTISLAPEGGSQRMRDMIRKNLTSGQIVSAAEAIARAGILNLRLYFIIGLPGETDEDLHELVRLVHEVREVVVEHARMHKRLGEITLSVNPFIPKPGTPLQWAGMCPAGILKDKIALLQGCLKKTPNVRLKVEELQGCILQALLSRGGREIVPLILKMSEGYNLKKASKICRIDVDASVTHTFSIDSELVWEVASVADRQRLAAEYVSAMKVIGVTV